MKIKVLISGLLIFCYISVNLSLVKAQEITSLEIDSLVQLTLKTFDVPGIAVAIVKDDQILWE